MRFSFHRISLLFSLAALAFVYGMAAGHFRWLPFRVARDAYLAVQAWREVVFSSENTATTLGEPRTTGFSDKAGDEWILLSAGDGYALERTPQYGCVAWLIDRAGRVQHEWRQPAQLWQQLRHVQTVPGKSLAYPVGLHLFTDGSLLANYQGRDCFPHAVGIAKLDRDSNLLWSRELLTHHWLSVTEDGHIALPALRVIESPRTFAGSQVQIFADKTKLLEDTILVLDPEGNRVQEISILDALAKSGYLGLFQGATDLEVTAQSWDPTHLNDVRVVDARTAADHTHLQAGDFLVSLRSINTVGILDAETREFKWLSSGATLRQHSPRFFRDGILVFDNRGGAAKSGGSRLVYLDLETRRPTVVFPVPGVSLPAPFESDTVGYVDLHPDGRRALVAVTHQNRVWEIDLTTGEVLWEYHYVHPIYTAMYCGDRQFVSAQQTFVSQ